MRSFALCDGRVAAWNVGLAVASPLPWATDGDAVPLKTVSTMGGLPGIRFKRVLLWPMTVGLSVQKVEKLFALASCQRSY